MGTGLAKVPCAGEANDPTPGKEILSTIILGKADSIAILRLKLLAMSLRKPSISRHVSA